MEVLHDLFSVFEISPSPNASLHRPFLFPLDAKIASDFKFIPPATSLRISCDFDATFQQIVQQIERRFGCDLAEHSAISNRIILL